MSRATLRRYYRHGLFPQLMVFEAVARSGSVTRAAQELHLAQPTVSMQLKKLSRTLEMQLFEPSGRGVRLTPAGEALREVCLDLMEVFLRAEERLAPHRASPCELPIERLTRLAAGFAREPLVLDAYNSPDEPEEKSEWSFRESTTRR